MKLALMASLSLVACGTDPAMTVTPDAPNTGGMVTNVSGAISASTTWSDTVHVTGATTINAGVTVTVMPGTAIDVASGAGITVLGTLDVEATSAATATLKPAATQYSGINIQAGGTLTAHYLVQTGGGIHLAGATATATLMDSSMSRDGGGDFFTMSDGVIDVEYSAFGLEPGMTDSTHCDMHFNSANSIKVTHSNVGTAVYGLMFYGGTGADFTYDNWFSNTTDLDKSPGPTGDFSNSWFEKGNPSGQGITANNMATARVTDAGPRP